MKLDGIRVRVLNEFEYEGETWLEVEPTDFKGVSREVKKSKVEDTALTFAIEKLGFLKKDYEKRLEYKNDMLETIEDLETGKRDDLLEIINLYSLVPFGARHQEEVMEIMDDKQEVINRLKRSVNVDEIGLEDLSNIIDIYTAYIERANK